MSFPSRNDNHNDLSLLERKIILATEGFTWIDIILDGTDEQFKDVVKALNPQIYSQIIKPREKWDKNDIVIAFPGDSIR